MVTRIAFAACVFACAFGLLGSAVAADSSSFPFAPGRILVAPLAGLPESALDRVLAQHGARSSGKLYGLDVHVVSVPPGLERAMASRIGAHPLVRFAEVDARMAAGAVVNDPSYASEWHLPKINAPAAWDASTGNGIVIAILDTGVDGTHPDLAAQMVAGWNFYDGNADTADVHGHGTAVAGAAAAASNNGVGIASIAGGARIMPVRIADPTAYAYWSTVAQGLTWAADHGADVANISYVGASASSTIQNAASYFRSKGGAVFVCAGNSGGVDNTAPTDLITVVSATDSNDQLASFSTYGAFVDIAAPGQSILTTARGGGYQYWSGTSLATPIVAGTAALIFAKRPDFSAAQVDSTLKSTATDLGAAGPDIYFGAGRVNAAAAVQLAASTATDTIPPVVSITSPTGGMVAGIVPVSVSASDNVGVTRVDLLVNGTVVASDTASPFQFAWDSTSVANGSATISARASDAAGNKATSTGVTVTVSNVVTDTTPPAISIANPANGSVVSGTVAITTSASDNGGTAGITQSIYLDGVLKATGNGATLKYNWNTRTAAKGTHTIKATARDSAGNIASAQIQVTR